MKNLDLTNETYQFSDKNFKEISWNSSFIFTNSNSELSLSIRINFDDLKKIFNYLPVDSTKKFEMLKEYLSKNGIDEIGARYSQPLKTEIIEIPENQYINFANLLDRLGIEGRLSRKIRKIYVVPPENGIKIFSKLNWEITFNTFIKADISKI